MTEDRKLATVEEILELHPIDGADRIELAKVRGWNVVVGKGLHKVGDEVVYFEIDSALPIEDPAFAFLAERGVKTMPDGQKVHVLKTIKLRGQVSQGLIIPLNELSIPFMSYLEVGDDVTDKLGIRKWDPALPLGTNIKGTFPTQYADKTDSERVQNLSGGQWAEIQSMEWFATEKVDGSSLTIVCDENGEIVIASRNYVVGEGTVHYRAAHDSGLIDEMVPGMVIQGEIVGPGVQNNPLRLDKVKVMVFDVWQDRKVLPRWEWPDKAYLAGVPLLDLDLPVTIEGAVEQADKLKSQVNPQVQAEGIVWHSHSGEAPHKLGRTTWKAINNSFLLKNGG